MKPQRLPLSLNGLFYGLSETTLRSCIAFVSKQILAGYPDPGEVARFAYAMYRKACRIEELSEGNRTIKKLNRDQFQRMIDPVAQSLWAYGDTTHAHLF